MEHKFTKQDQRALATWAADCAKRTLPFFEDAFPKDDRPRKAIGACWAWVRTGVFSMRDIRKAALDSHAAARKAKGKGNDAACFAARAAGQAVATAHVPLHAYGSAYYGLKVVMAANANIVKEFEWQTQHLPKYLRKGWMEWQSLRLPKSLRKMWQDWRSAGGRRL